MITNIRNNNKKQLYQLLNTKYSSKQQSLDLWLESENWEQAIIERDWSSLQILILNKCDITALKLNKIIELKWTNLRQLFLSGNNIGSLGTNILVRCNIPQLSQLRINNCFIGDQGGKNLTKGNWKYLQSLTIYNNFMTFVGESWMQYGKWNKLQKFIGKFFTLHTTWPISALSLTLLQSKNCQIQMNIECSQKMKQNIQNIFNNKQNQSI